MSRTVRDLGVIAVIVLFAALIYWASLDLRAGRYDPLGAGTMPRMVAVATIALCLVAAAQSLLASRGQTPRKLAEDLGFAPQPWLAVQVFAAMVACTALLWARIPFGVSASLFLFVSVLAMRRFRPSVVPAAAAFSLTCGFGLSHLFGAIFGVDLP